MSGRGGVALTGLIGIGLMTAGVGALAGWAWGALLLGVILFAVSIAAAEE